MSLAFYLQMRGQSLANPKRVIGLIATFFGEQIPGVDAIGLPLWTLDGVYNFLLSKSEKIIEQIPGGKTVTSITEKSK